MRRAAALIYLSRVALGHVEVAGDETGGEAESTRRLHHQSGEIAAGSTTGGQGLKRALRSTGRAALIQKPLLDRVGQSHQQCSGFRRTSDMQETTHPTIDLAIGVGVMAFDRASEVGHFLRVV